MSARRDRVGSAGHTRDGDGALADLPADDSEPAEERRRKLRADPAETDAAVGQVEYDVGTRLPCSFREVSDREVRGGPGPEHCTRENVRTKHRLVDVDADSPYVMLPRGLQAAETAPTRDLENDSGSGGDLLPRHGTALDGAHEVVGVGGHD